MNNGGPAFVLNTVLVNADSPTPPNVPCGLSKLEWFAGVALQGILSSPLEIQREFINSGAEIGLNPQESIASCAFECAEAMLSESERRSKA